MKRCTVCMLVQLKIMLLTVFSLSNEQEQPTNNYSERGNDGGGGAIFDIEQLVKDRVRHSFMTSVRE